MMMRSLTSVIFLFLLMQSTLFANNSFLSLLREDKYYSPKTYDTLSVYAKYYSPARIFNILDGSPGYFWAYGFSYNALRFDYSKFYEGVRYSVLYDFQLKSAVSPYIGLSLIKDTEISYKTGQDSIEYLDGINPVIGLSLNYFKYVKPYIEYMAVDSMVMFGVRFHLAFHIKKTSSKILDYNK